MYVKEIREALEQQPPWERKSNDTPQLWFAGDKATTRTTFHCYGTDKEGESTVEGP